MAQLAPRPMIRVNKFAFNCEHYFIAWFSKEANFQRQHLFLLFFNQEEHLYVGPLTTSPGLAGTGSGDGGRVLDRP